MDATASDASYGQMHECSEDMSDSLSSGRTEHQQKHVSVSYDHCLHSTSWIPDQNGTSIDTRKSINHYDQTYQDDLHTHKDHETVLPTTGNGYNATDDVRSNASPISDGPNKAAYSNQVMAEDDYSNNASNEMETESQESFSNNISSRSFLRKGLLAALSHDAELPNRTDTPDTDSIHSYDTEGFEESSSLAGSESKTKGRRSKKWLDEDDGKSPLSYELKIGVRILGDFMVEANRSLTWPFLNKVDPERDGVPDYFEHIKKPVWFKKMKEKFATREYKGIDEFVSDFRTMLQNCYRYNGPDHSISKKAQKLETMLEQKLSLLSRELREKIEKNSIAGSGHVESIYARRRRPHVPHNSTALLSRLRLEQTNRERELRRQQMEERRLLQENQSRVIDEWESFILTEDERRRRKAMPELPEIGLLLFLCQGPLNIGEVAQWDLERSFLMPRQSSTMQLVMTTLLSTPYQRARLHKTTLMPYSVWEEKLRAKTVSWYKVYKETLDIEKTAEKLAIDPKIFKVLGYKNPMSKLKFHDLSYYQRVWLVKTLCETCVDQQESLREAIEAQPSAEHREYVLGEDSNGYTYVHFPQFCGADLRVYRHSSHELPEYNVDPPSPVKKGVKRKQNLSTRYAVARRKLMAEKAKAAKQAQLEESMKDEPNEEKVVDSVANHATSSSENENGGREDSDSGISHSESENESTCFEMRSRKSKRLKEDHGNDKRKYSGQQGKSQDKLAEKASTDASPSPAAGLTPGRVTRSAWKKNVEEFAAAVEASAKGNTPRKSRRRTSRRRKNEDGEVSPNRSYDCSRSQSTSPAATTRDRSQTSTPNPAGKEEKHEEIESASMLVEETEEASVVDSNETSVPEVLKNTCDSNKTNESTCDTTIENQAQPSLCEHKENTSVPDESVDVPKEQSDLHSLSGDDSDKTNSVQDFIDKKNEKSNDPSSDLPPGNKKSHVNYDVSVNLQSEKQEGEPSCSDTVENSQNKNEVLHTNVSDEETAPNEKNSELLDGHQLERDSSLPLKCTKAEESPDILDNKSEEELNDTNPNSSISQPSQTSKTEENSSKDESVKENKNDADLKKENESESEIAEIIMSISIKAVKEEDDIKEEQADVQGKQLEDAEALDGEIKKENDVNAEAVKTEPVEDEESELDEPEITEPDYDEFEMVCETVDELRQLAEKFKPEEATKKRTGQASKASCELELRSRLAFLLKELEPWEAKLLQANRRMKVKLKREVDNYVEEPVKTATQWEESDTSAAEASGGSDDEDDRDSTCTASSTDPFAPALRPRRRKTATPTPDSSVDRYMDRTEEYGCSSKGRMRKRRIIPNNAEDQCSPVKRTRLVITSTRSSARKPVVTSDSDSPMTETNLLKSSTINAPSAPRSALNPSNMQHLIFQQPDGRHFAINENQTLLLRGPSSTPGVPAQIIQIPGSVAIKNPSIISQLLSSCKLGPGTTAMLVPSHALEGQYSVHQIEQLLKGAATSEGAQNTGNQTQVQVRSIASTIPTATFPPYQFKTTAAQWTTNAPNAQVSAQPMKATIVKKVEPKHVPRILLSPNKGDSPQKTIPINQLPQSVLNQLPASVLAEIAKLKQAGAPLEVQINQTPSSQHVQKVATTSPGPAQIMVQTVSKQQPVQVNVMSSQMNRSPLRQAKPIVSASQMNYVGTSPPTAAMRPKYSGIVTVKELLERQVAQERGQGEKICLQMKPVQQNDEEAVCTDSPDGKNSSSKQSLFTRSDTQEAAEALLGLEARVAEKRQATAVLMDTSEETDSDDEHVSSFTGDENTMSDEASTNMPSNSQKLSPSYSSSIPQPTRPVPIAVRQSISPGAAATIKILPSGLNPIASVAASAGAQKVALVGKSGKTVAVVNAAKLQELIARKEAVDKAVKQVITEVPTTLPTVQIKVSSPFAMPNRQSARPCTAATMSLKHPIPAILPISSGFGSVSNSSRGSQLPTSRSTITHSPNSMGNLTANSSPLPAVTSAPTALVSVKTTPPIHPTEITAASISTSPLRVASTRPQTVQVIGSFKNATYNLAQQGTSTSVAQRTQPTSIILQPGVKSVSQRPGLNVAKLREQGMVLVRTADGQLQLVPSNQQTTPVVKATKQSGNVASTVLVSSDSYLSQAGPLSSAFVQRSVSSVAPCSTGNIKSLPTVTAAQQRGGLLNQPIARQGNTQLRVPMQTVSLAQAKNITGQVPQQNSSANTLLVNQVQTPRLVLQPAQLAVQNQQKPPVLGNLVQPQLNLLGAAALSQQGPRLMLVNVNGQLMVQAVPGNQVQASLAPVAGLQLVQPAASNILQASNIQLAQPSLQVASQPAVQQLGIQLAHTPVASQLANISLTSIQQQQALRSVVLQGGVGQQANLTLIPAVSNLQSHTYLAASVGASQTMPASMGDNNSHGQPF